MAVPSLLAEFDGLVSANHPGQEGGDSATRALDELSDGLDNVHKQIAGLEWDLKNYIPPLTADQYASYAGQTSDLQKAVSDLLNDTQNVINQELLLPALFARWKELESTLTAHLEHLAVYGEELKAVFEGRVPDAGLGRLVYLEQPFPAVVKQKEKKRSKQTIGDSEPLRLKLLTGARAPLTVLSKVRAEMIFDAAAPAAGGASKKKKEKAVAPPKKGRRKKKTDDDDDDDDEDEDEPAPKAKASKAASKAASVAGEDAVIGGLTDMQPNGQAMFEQLRFSKGTGVKIVRLRFSCNAETSGAAVPGCPPKKFVVESPMSAPFIVMTNESQFADSAAKLLETDAFAPGVTAISWNRFANLLQFHYLMCTRQQLTKILRPLTRADLAYFWETRFNKSKQVSKKAYDLFWQWFGPTLHKIRHQKPVPQMWEKGYIFGFISKEAAAEILKPHKVGTFLVRFSERTAGHFAVAYVGKEGKIKHYLVPPSTKKLSDLLKEKHDFTQVLLCKTDFKVESFQAMVSGTMQKDGAFGEFYTTGESAPPADGYDDIDGDE